MQKRRVWIKFHFKTQQGIKTLTGPEADAMKGKDLIIPTRSC